MNITVKQLESIGIGIIRAEHIKNTLSGRVYKATVYYDNKSIDVAILYYRTGGGKILGPIVKEKSEISSFTDFMKYIIPRIPKPNQTILRALRMAIIVSALTTIANTSAIITATVMTSKDLLIILIDIAITLALVIMERRERNIYDRE